MSQFSRLIKLTIFTDRLTAGRLHEADQAMNSETTAVQSIKPVVKQRDITEMLLLVALDFTLPG